jgi:hypothetical protein
MSAWTRERGGWPEHVNKDRTTKSGQLWQDSQHSTASTGQPAQDSQHRQPGQDSYYRTAGICKMITFMLSYSQMIHFMLSPSKIIPPNIYGMLLSNPMNNTM